MDRTICYCCGLEIQTGFYWQPCARPGIYAAICRECHKRDIENKKEATA